MMIKEVIPAIMTRMPGASTRTIWVQQDGAKPHACSSWGKHHTKTQPPNSPDLNVLGLSIFHSIQRLKDDFGVTNVRELVGATIEAFDDYPRETLERCCTGFLQSMVKF
ncbi:unnamed protein product [Discosporangium mesarthrocarpum]